MLKKSCSCCNRVLQPNKSVLVSTHVEPMYNSTSVFSGYAPVRYVYRCVCGCLWSDFVIGSVELHGHKVPRKWEIDID